MFLLTSPNAIGLSKPPEAGGFTLDLVDDVDHEAGIEGMLKLGTGISLEGEKHLK